MDPEPRSSPSLAMKRKLLSLARASRAHVERPAFAASYTDSSTLLVCASPPLKLSFLTEGSESLGLEWTLSLWSSSVMRTTDDFVIWERTEAMPLEGTASKAYITRMVMPRKSLREPLQLRVSATSGGYVLAEGAAFVCAPEEARDADVARSLASEGIHALRSGAVTELSIPLFDVAPTVAPGHPAPRAAPHRCMGRLEIAMLPLSDHPWLAPLSSIPRTPHVKLAPHDLLLPTLRSTLYLAVDLDRRHTLSEAVSGADVTAAAAESVPLPGSAPEPGSGGAPADGAPGSARRPYTLYACCLSGSGEPFPRDLPPLAVGQLWWEGGAWRCDAEPMRQLHLPPEVLRDPEAHILLLIALNPGGNGREDDGSSAGDSETASAANGGPSPPPLPRVVAFAYLALHPSPGVTLQNGAYPLRVHAACPAVLPCDADGCPRLLPAAPLLTEVGGIPPPCAWVGVRDREPAATCGPVLGDLAVGDPEAPELLVAPPRWSPVQPRSLSDAQFASLHATVSPPRQPPLPVALPRVLRIAAYVASVSTVQEPGLGQCMRLHHAPARGMSWLLVHGAAAMRKAAPLEVYKCRRQVMRTLSALYGFAAREVAAGERAGSPPADGSRGGGRGGVEELPLLLRLRQRGKSLRTVLPLCRVLADVAAKLLLPAAFAQPRLAAAARDALWGETPRTLMEDVAQWLLWQLKQARWVRSAGAAQPSGNEEEEEEEEEEGGGIGAVSAEVLAAEDVGVDPFRVPDHCRGLVHALATWFAVVAAGTHHAADACLRARERVEAAPVDQARAKALGAYRDACAALARWRAAMRTALATACDWSPAVMGHVGASEGAAEDVDGASSSGEDGARCPLPPLAVMQACLLQGASRLLAPALRTLSAAEVSAQLAALFSSPLLLARLCRHAGMRVDGDGSDGESSDGGEGGDGVVAETALRLVAHVFRSPPADGGSKVPQNPSAEDEARVRSALLPAAVAFLRLWLPRRAAAPTESGAPLDIMARAAAMDNVPGATPKPQARVAGDLERLAEACAREEGIALSSYRPLPPAAHELACALLLGHLPRCASRRDVLPAGDEPSARDKAARDVATCTLRLAPALSAQLLLASRATPLADDDDEEILVSRYLLSCTQALAVDGAWLLHAALDAADADGDGRAPAGEEGGMWPGRLAHSQVLAASVQAVTASWHAFAGYRDTLGGHRVTVTLLTQSLAVLGVLAQRVLAADVGAAPKAEGGEGTGEARPDTSGTGSSSDTSAASGPHMSQVAHEAAWMRALIVVAAACADPGELSPPPDRATARLVLRAISFIHGLLRRWGRLQRPTGASPPYVGLLVSQLLVLLERVAASPQSTSTLRISLPALLTEATLGGRGAAPGGSDDTSAAERARQRAIELYARAVQREAMAAADVPAWARDAVKGRAQATSAAAASPRGGVTFADEVEDGVEEGGGEGSDPLSADDVRETVEEWDWFFSMAHTSGGAEGKDSPPPPSRGLAPVQEEVGGGANAASKGARRLSRLRRASRGGSPLSKPGGATLSTGQGRSPSSSAAAASRQVDEGAMLTFRDACARGIVACVQAAFTLEGACFAASPRALLGLGDSLKSKQEEQEEQERQEQRQEQQRLQQQQQRFQSSPLFASATAQRGSDARQSPRPAARPSASTTAGVYGPDADGAAGQGSPALPATLNLCNARACVGVLAARLVRYVEGSTVSRRGSVSAMMGPSAPGSGPSGGGGGGGGRGGANSLSGGLATLRRAHAAGRLDKAASSVSSSSASSAGEGAADSDALASPWALEAANAGVRADAKGHLLLHALLLQTSRPSLNGSVCRQAMKLLGEHMHAFEADFLLREATSEAGAAAAAAGEAAGTAPPTGSSTGSHARRRSSATSRASSASATASEASEGGEGGTGGGTGGNSSGVVTRSPVRRALYALRDVSRAVSAVARVFVRHITELRMRTLSARTHESVVESLARLVVLTHHTHPRLCLHYLSALSRAHEAQGRHQDMAVAMASMALYSFALARGGDSVELLSRRSAGQHRAELARAVGKGVPSAPAADLSRVAVLHPSYLRLALWHARDAIAFCTKEGQTATAALLAREVRRARELAHALSGAVEGGVEPAPVPAPPRDRSLSEVGAAVGAGAYSASALGSAGEEAAVEGAREEETSLVGRAVSPTLWLPLYFAVHVQRLVSDVPGAPARVHSAWYLHRVPRSQTVRDYLRTLRREQHGEAVVLGPDHPFPSTLLHDAVALASPLPAVNEVAVRPAYGLRRGHSASVVDADDGVGAGSVASDDLSDDSDEGDFDGGSARARTLSRGGSFHSGASSASDTDSPRRSPSRAGPAQSTSLRRLSLSRMGRRVSQGGTSPAALASLGSAVKPPSAADGAVTCVMHVFPAFPASARSFDVSEASPGHATPPGGQASGADKGESKAGEGGAPESHSPSLPSGRTSLAWEFITFMHARPHTAPVVGACEEDEEAGARSGKHARQAAAAFAPTGSTPVGGGGGGGGGGGNRGQQSPGLGQRGRVTESAGGRVPRRSRRLSASALVEADENAAQMREREQQAEDALAAAASGDDDPVHMEARLWLQREFPWLSLRARAQGVSYRRLLETRRSHSWLCWASSQLREAWEACAPAGGEDGEGGEADAVPSAGARPPPNAHQPQQQQQQQQQPQPQPQPQPQQPQPQPQQSQPAQMQREALGREVERMQVQLQELGRQEQDVATVMAQQQQAVQPQCLYEVLAQRGVSLGEGEAAPAWAQAAAAQMAGQAVQAEWQAQLQELQIVKVQLQEQLEQARAQLQAASSSPPKPQLRAVHKLKRAVQRMGLVNRLALAGSIETPLAPAKVQPQLAAERPTERVPGARLAGEAELERVFLSDDDEAGAGHAGFGSDEEAEEQGRAGGDWGTEEAEGTEDEGVDARAVAPGSTSAAASNLVQGVRPAVQAPVPGVSAASASLHDRALALCRMLEFVTLPGLHDQVGLEAASRRLRDGRQRREELRRKARTQMKKNYIRETARCRREGLPLPPPPDYDSLRLQGWEPRIARVARRCVEVDALVQSLVEVHERMCARMREREDPERERHAAEHERLIRYVSVD